MNALQGILRKNANEMGLTLVKNYSAVEEDNMGTLEILLSLCTGYIAEREGIVPPEELEAGLLPFMDGLTDLYGKDSIQVYSRFAGRETLTSNTPEIEGLIGYDVTSSAWYQGGARAGGETYLSPLYTDAVTGLPVIPMCRVIPQTGSFLPSI